MKKSNKKILIIIGLLLVGVCGFASFKVLYNPVPKVTTIHFEVEEETPDGDKINDKAVLFLPEGYSDEGDKTRLIISCHGSGRVIDENTDLEYMEYLPFLNYMGYAIMDVNGVVEDGRHYGADFAVQSYVDAYNYVIDNYNVYDEVFVLGASMGGLSSFNLVESGQVPVLAHGAFCPVTDLYRQAWNFPWYGGEEDEKDYSIQRKAIADYYDFSPADFINYSSDKEPSEEEKLYFLDNVSDISYPMISNSNYDQIDLFDGEGQYDELVKEYDVPLKIWQSKEDPTVPYIYSQYIVDAINRSENGNAEIELFDEGGHSPYWGDIEKVKNNGVEFETYQNIYELYEFYKSFE